MKQEACMCQSQGLQFLQRIRIRLCVKALDIDCFHPWFSLAVAVPALGSYSTGALVVSVQLL